MCNTSQKRLVVVKHIDREGPGLFLKLANEYKLKVIEVKVYLDQKLPKPLKTDIFLFLGGPMGISDINNQHFGWLNDEIKTIKELIALDIPCIGICLGAQLLAFASGGNVTPLLDTKKQTPVAEIGWYPITNFDRELAMLMPNESIESIYCLHWHSDRILLPSNAKLLASSSRCREQMFKIGKKAYGMQFHLEIELQDVKRWINEDGQYIIKHLGVDGKDFLYKQNELFCLKTKFRRLEFLRNLIALLII